MVISSAAKNARHLAAARCSAAGPSWPRSRAFSAESRAISSAGSGTLEPFGPAPRVPAGFGMGEPVLCLGGTLLRPHKNVR